VTPQANVGGRVAILAFKKIGTVSVPRVQEELSQKNKCYLCFKMGFQGHSELLRKLKIATDLAKLNCTTQ